MKFRADAVRTDAINRTGFFGFVIAVATNHINVNLRDNLIERNRWIISKITRPPESLLFPSVPDENQGAFRLLSRCKGFRYGETPHRAGAVIIRAVADPGISVSFGGALARTRQTIAVFGFLQFALGITNVVIVRAVGNIRVFQFRVCAFDDADDIARVLGANGSIISINIESDAD